MRRTKSVGFDSPSLARAPVHNRAGYLEPESIAGSSACETRR